MKGRISLRNFKNCNFNKCPNNKIICCKLPKHIDGQRGIRAIPYCESVLSRPSPAPAITNAFGYRFDPEPISSLDPITEIPFKSIGSINGVIATQNGLRVPAGVYEIIAQVTIDYIDPVVVVLSIAVNGIPIDTTTFIASSVSPSSSAVTIQSLKSSDVITLVTLNPPTEFSMITGNLAIKKLN